MTDKKHIFLAEDDYDFGSILKQYLEMNNYEVTWAKDGKEALEEYRKLNASAVDICVFDVMMPKMDGFTLAEEIIKITPEMPFVFLTARKMKEDKIKGLKLGADDYIVKPFEADELVLRINNIIKRSTRTIVSQEKISMLKIGKYTLDTKRLELTLDEQKQQLTEKEGALIQFLYQHKNTLLKREEILINVWKNDDFFSGRSMDVFFSRLRKYFKDDSNISLESIRGVGMEFRVR